MTDIPTYYTPVATQTAEVRGQFIINVYKHLLLAVAAFIGFETVLFATGIAEAMFDFLIGSGGIAWLLVLGVVMIGQNFAVRAASDISNVNLQYAGLFGMALLESLLFAPFLYLAFNYTEGGTVTVGAAAAITALGFAVLTVIAFVTRKDLSFLRPMIMWGFGGAMLLIVGALIFGFELGIWFSVGMIVLTGGLILYKTQQIMATYPNEAHVAAAVQLFAAVMTMFWYVLRLLMELRR